MGILRVVLGTITTAAGGKGLIVSRGDLDKALPAVVAHRGSTQQALMVVPAPMRNELAAAFRAFGVQVFQFFFPPMTAGSVTLSVNRGSSFASARFRPIPTDTTQPISFAFSSCYYSYFQHAAAYGTTLQAAADSAQIAGHQIDFKLLIGDNLYMDVAPDQAAYSDGWTETAARYTRYFADDEGYARGLSSSPGVFTFDDHELWNDYPYTSFWLSRTGNKAVESYTAAGLDAVRSLQASLNPAGGALEGLSFAFAAGGVEFFVADMRTERTFTEAAAPRLMPEQDFAQLLQWLAGRNGPRVLILGQPIWQEAECKVLNVTGDHNLAAYADQYGRLLEGIRTAPWQILVLAGDVHFSRVLRLAAGNREFFEVVSSPAVRIPTIGVAITNFLLGGGMNQQGISDVEIANHVEYSGPAAAKPRVKAYLHGTRAPNSLGLLTITRRSASSAAARVTLIDYGPGSRLLPLPEAVSPYPTPNVQSSTVEFALNLENP